MNNFSRNGDFGCSLCPEEITNILRLLGVLIGVIFALVMLIRSTLRGATARKNVMSIYTKIIMNHLQLLVIASSFNY